MKKFCFTAATTMALCLAACQNSENAPPVARKPDSPASAPAATPPPAKAADARPVIACFGDSLTAGMGLDPGQSFPDLLQQDLDSRGYRYRVANLGVSGDTTQDGIERLPLVIAEKP